MTPAEPDSEAPVTGSEALTDGIRVQVRARFSPDHSHPAESRWFFLYTIRISNEGETAAQLLNRHWIIIDGTGHIEEVRGEGVIGQQPSLEPGQSFEYTSGCPLGTPFGSMSGTYEMQRADGLAFEAEVALFELVQPTAIH